MSDEIVTRCSQWAACLDQMRVAPRLLCLGYGYVCWRVFEWYTSLPDPSATQMAFATLIYGASAAWFGLYVNSGPHRNQ